jgi:lysophospholipase L1-like esterase
MVRRRLGSRSPVFFAVASLTVLAMLVPVVAVGVGPAAASTSSASSSSTSTSSTSTPSTSDPTSILQLGDSIASGEGTLYGFTFDTATGKWEGPEDKNPNWIGPYPECHESPDAYGQVLTTTYYPKAKFTQLACTGATFNNGVAGPWSDSVPAEFGDWVTKTGLNQVYTDAKPDLVLVTLGADDVHFAEFATKCAEAAITSSTACTKAYPNGPDDIIKNDFYDQLPTIEAVVETLAEWITARGKQLGVVPKIVFTTYANPIPDDAPAGGKDFCPDSWLFYNDQIDYFSSLFPILDNAIVQAVNTYVSDTGATNVAVVNLADAFDGHRWCTKDSTKAGDNPDTKDGDTYVEPDAYGFSIYKSYFDTSNPSPLHPTPEGQKVIATDVQPAVAKLFPAAK